MKKITKDLEWKDISHEKYRTYIFYFDKKIRIDKPLKLNVSKSGGHRILDIKNISHYIPYKWIHLYWETDDDCAYRF